MRDEIIDYLRHLRGRASTSLYDQRRIYLGIFENYCRRLDKSFDRITRSDIEELLRQRDCSGHTRQVLWRSIRDLYEHLGYGEDNPARGITIRTPPRTVRRAPTAGQIRQALERIRRLQRRHRLLGLRARVLFELAYGSGLRRGELVGLDTEQVDLAGQCVYVVGKGRKSRIVPLSTAACRALHEYLEYRGVARGPLFVSILNDRRLSTHRIYQVFRYDIGLHPHLLRHGCATHMLERGCSTRVLKDLLGHSLLTTTQDYVHTTCTGLRRVVDRCHPRSS